MSLLSGRGSLARERLDDEDCDQGANPLPDSVFPVKNATAKASTITIRSHFRNFSGEAGTGTAATGMAAAASFARVCARR
jgi:hypothetical protein